MDWLRELIRRLGMLRRRSAFDAELEEEIRLHLDLRQEQHLASGMPVQRAREIANRQFGNPLRLQEKSHTSWGWSWLEDGIQDLQFGARMLRNSPGFAALAILTLAVGIGANTAIFSVVNSVLLRPLPYPEADQLAILWSGFGDTSRAPATTFELFQIRQQSKEFEQVAGIWVTNGALPGDGEAEQVKVASVSSNFLPLLCAKPALGRFFNSADENPKSTLPIIISHGVWVRRFGSDPSLIGKTVRFGRGSAVVIGVLPKGFRLMLAGGSSVPSNVDVFYSIPINANNPLGPAFLRLIGRLRPGSNIAKAQAEADSIAKQITSFDENSGISNFHLYVYSLQADDVREVRSTLLLLFGGVAFVLLIGCANLASLLTARSTHRLRETAVRMALGASHGRLVRQLLTESFLLACFGAVAALGIGWSAMRAILAVRPPALANLNDIKLDWRVLVFTFVLAILSSALFGLVPLAALRRLDLTDTLKETARPAGWSKGYWSRLLVSVEVALGFVL
ncbi:MAG TPA: ABC transporter permease, partial [Terriglobales bacterium]|nr:ABC transporter permease [Terriglobales bacterium]